MTNPHTDKSRTKLRRCLTWQILLGQFAALLALAFQLVVLLSEFENLDSANRAGSTLSTKIATVLGSGTVFSEIIFFALTVLFIHIIWGLLTVAIYRLVFYFTRIRERLVYYFLFALLCWLCLAGWATLFFPYSRQSFVLDLLFRYNDQYRYLLLVASTLIVLFSIYSVVRIGVQSFVRLPGNKSRVLITGAALTLIGSLAFVDFQKAASSGGIPDRLAKPDIYIIGIDSLNLSLLDSSIKETLPELRNFIQDAIVFDDASTPLARTFPAWMAILSGKYPVTSGIRINLQPRALMSTDGLISHQLQSIGYKTYYSTDETRFANIDHSFGFDHVLTAKQGALDFLIGTFNDFWLSNFLVNHNFFGRLFPYNFLNRAANHHYQPSTYSNYLANQMDQAYQIARKDRHPLFFAIHLCTPHWPYDITPDYSNANLFNNLAPEFGKHARNLMVIDRQLSVIMESIKRSGRYDQSWIFLISDHGEELPSNSSALLDEGNNQVVRFGHGTNVLSNEQYGVMLAFKAPQDLHNSLAVNRNKNVSLVDIAPTIAEIVGFDVKVDGVSLLDNSDFAGQRVILRESGYTPSSIGKTGITEAALINRVADYYQTASDGRFEFKPELLPSIFKKKYRAIEYGEEILGLEFLPDTNSWEWRLKRDDEVITFDPNGEEAGKNTELINQFCNNWGKDLAESDVCPLDLES